MPTTDCAAHAASPDAPGFDCQIEVSSRASRGTSRPLRGLFFGFAATVTIGLALASWYVGVRIVSAGEVSAAGSARPTAVVETVVESQPARDVPPRQFYLQTAGLGEKQDAAFVRSLKDRGFHAEVRTPAGESGRIEIGPFSTHTEMEAARSKLGSWGVLVIEAEHY